MVQEYVKAEFRLDGFNCPTCKAFANQKWYEGISYKPGRNQNTMVGWLNAVVAICDRCHNYSIWKDGQLIYPQMSVAPLPAVEMPEEVKQDYEEARQIVGRSPRSAGALLRLGIQKLVIILGASGELNKGIGELVKKGLREDIQQALDVVRVVGNHCVHPGVIDVRDDPKIVDRLFKITNIIVEQMITQPREIRELYEIIPPGEKEGISKRDRKNESSS